MKETNDLRKEVAEKDENVVRRMLNNVDPEVVSHF